MPAIETYGLTRKFGERMAVEDLTLTAEKGEVLAFLGPNGAGKTTTSRMLAGIISPTSGYAIVADYRSGTEVSRLHERIGLLTESPGFYDRLSARRNLEYFARFYGGVDVAAQVDKYLKLMGLWERKDDRVGTFSKGMKQRLALARALLHEPEVLFLDEPTAGLDPEAAQDIRGLIAQLGREGRTIFLSTHNLAEAEQLCHRVAVVRTRLLALDTAEQLRRRFFRRQVVVHLDAPDNTLVEALRRLPFVQDVRQQGDQLTVELAEPERTRPELVRSIVQAGGRVLSVSDEQHPLEEVYLRLVREEAGGDS